MNNENLKGRARSGKATADKLTYEQKVERARKGAMARWSKRMPKATHKGNFKEKLGFDVECYVLEDKTAVISQRGMHASLGFSEGGGRLMRFATSAKMSPYVAPEIRQKLENPIIFQGVAPGPNIPLPTVHGYDVTLLIDLCNAIIQAEEDGVLQARYSNISKQARVIVNASAKLGIKMLVYAVVGYKPEDDAVIQAWKAFVSEEAKKYEQEFPNELYLAWQRLYKIPIPARGKPWQFMHLTRRHIYYPLAKSQGKVLELLRALREKDGEQKRYLFQFLNDIGARALRMHMGRVLEMAESAEDDAVSYERKFDERFGDQQELDFLPKEEPTAST